MKEIKFRAWDKENEIMFNPSKVWGIDKAIQQGCELMQYTGLKDKNVKEIYEGDIVRDINGLLFEVAMFDKGWCIRGINNVNRYIGWEETCVEIIGNIHENPELLKEDVI